MKFGIQAELARLTPDETVEKNLATVVDIFQTAEEGGFDMGSVGEHHGHEYTIAPNPFTLLTYLADRTTSLRLGTAVVCAPYWHPIRLAGEAALFDHLSNGRLELGIGRGAFPYEFDRMANGIQPEQAREALGEILPALRGLWAGDYAHEGANWKFKTSTSCPRPLTPEGPPLWVSARHPDSFRIAVENRAHVMVNPLGLGIEEAISLNDRRKEAVAKYGNGFEPKMAMLRSTHVAESEEEVLMAAEAYIEHRGHFDNLFDTDGDVREGWVQFRDPREHGQPDWADTDLIRRNQIYDTPGRMIDRIREYEAAGTDMYMYAVPPRIPPELQLESIRRFCREIIPAFKEDAEK